MGDPLDDLSERQHGVFSERQARRAGFTRSAIRHRRDRGIWTRAAPRVLRPRGAPMTKHAVLMAAVLSLGDDCVVSHQSAAALHGLPGFSLLPPEVTVLRRPHAVPGVTVHQSFCLPAHHRTLLLDIPTASLARVLFDLAGTLDPRRSARLVDTALGRRMVRYESLVRVLTDLAEQGRAGTAVMRELLDARHELFVAPESELEARFLELVDRWALPKPAAQVDLGDASGWIGRVDFLWRDQRVIVELDGAASHTALLDREADAARDARLAATGWQVRRLTWREVVHEPARTAAALRELLHRDAA
jgi:hypothetical protein